MEKSTVTPRPYRWGRFQGWTIFIISLATMSFSVLAGSLPGAVGALQGVFTGWGLIKKRRYGLVLFLANAALAGLAATVMTLYAVIMLSPRLRGIMEIGRPSHLHVSARRFYRDGSLFRHGSITGSAGANLANLNPGYKR